MPQAELSAGGIRVFAAGAAEHRLDAVLHEDVEEHHHRRFGRRLEVWTVLDGRKGDEVHLGHRDAADLARESLTPLMTVYSKVMMRLVALV